MSKLLVKADAADICDNTKQRKILKHPSHVDENDEFVILRKKKSSKGNGKDYFDEMYV